MINNYFLISKIETAVLQLVLYAYEKLEMNGWVSRLHKKIKDPYDYQVSTSKSIHNGVTQGFNTTIRGYFFVWHEIIKKYM